MQLEMYQNTLKSYDKPYVIKLKFYIILLYIYCKSLPRLSQFNIKNVTYLYRQKSEATLFEKDLTCDGQI